MIKAAIQSFLMKFFAHAIYINKEKPTGEVDGETVNVDKNDKPYYMVKLRNALNPLDGTIRTYVYRISGQCTVEDAAEKGFIKPSEMLKMLRQDPKGIEMKVWVAETDEYSIDANPEPVTGYTTCMLPTSTEVDFLKECKRQDIPVKMADAQPAVAGGAFGI
jgi:hypothetical protein